LSIPLFSKILYNHLRWALETSLTKIQLDLFWDIKKSSITSIKRKESYLLFKENRLIFSSFWIHNLLFIVKTLLKLLSLKYFFIKRSKDIFDWLCQSYNNSSIKNWSNRKKTWSGSSKSTKLFLPTSSIKYIVFWVLTWLVIKPKWYSLNVAFSIFLSKIIFLFSSISLV